MVQQFCVEQNYKYKKRFKKRKKLWRDRIPPPAKYILFRSVEPSFSLQVPWRHKCVRAHKVERGLAMRARRRTIERYICVVWQNVWTRLACVCLLSLFSSDMPFLFLLILSIYYSFSPFLSHSTIEHVPLLNLKRIPLLHIYSTESRFDCTCLSINNDSIEHKNVSILNFRYRGINSQLTLH